MRRPAKAVVGWLLLPKLLGGGEDVRMAGGVIGSIAGTTSVCRENSETQLRTAAIHLLLRRATGLRSKYPYRYKAASPCRWPEAYGTGSNRNEVGWEFDGRTPHSTIPQTGDLERVDQHSR